MNFDIIKPTLSDIPAMRALVSEEVKKGVILERSEDEMANAIRSYQLARVRDSGELAGFCALHVHSCELAEVRSLMVGERYRAHGLGSELVGRVLEEARALGVAQVLTLTYRASLFERLGFAIIDKSQLPNHKIWADCIKCKHFPICDEVALINTLR